jgi:hypothetical protein
MRNESHALPDTESRAHGIEAINTGTVAGTERRLAGSTPAPATHTPLLSQLAREPIMVTTDLVNLHTTLHTNGGFTVRNGSLQPVVSGFAVSTTDRQWSFPESLPFDHFAAVVEQLHSYYPDADAFGAWVDSETHLLYFDPIAIYTDQAKAEQAGREHGEIAIFDLDSFTEIRL